MHIRGVGSRGMAMGDVVAADGAVFEAMVCLSHFNDLADPRQAGKVMYPLAEGLLMAVLAGADSFVDIARSGEKKRDLLRRFQPFRDGTPSHDQLGGIFAALDAEQFQHRFVAWGAAPKRHNWPGPKAIVIAASRRAIGGKIEQETRFHITSLILSASLLGPIARSHWAVENSLHWVMDVIFRTNHMPANFTTLKHLADNLFRKAPGKDSLRLSRKTAGWNDDFLASLVSA